MKRLFSLLFVFMFIVNCCYFNAFAFELQKQDKLISRTIEVLDNGDTVIIELYENAAQPRTGTSGHKSFTYRNTAGTAIWGVTVNGTFSYQYGVSSTATSASAVVNIYNSSAVFQSKNAWTSGSTAWASATVKYDSSVMTRSVSVSCDKYGNLY